MVRGVATIPRVSRHLKHLRVQFRRRSTQINGNINTAGCEFSGVERNLDVFVGGSNPNTSEDVIVNHIASKGIQVVKCEKIAGKVDWYVPFEVTVKASDRYKLLNPDIWP